MPVKRPSARELNITFSENKIMLSAAAGELFSSRVEIYERDNVIALVNDPDGSLHLARNNSRNLRKDIYSEMLCKYLQQKYSLDKNRSLGAWFDGRALLFGEKITNEQVETGFDATRFKRMRLEEHKACTVRVTGARLIVSADAAECLGEAVFLYENGGVLCINSDKTGVLRPTNYCEGRKAKVIASDELTMWIYKRFPNRKTNIFKAWIKDGRVYFSPEEKIKSREVDFSDFTKIVLKNAYAGMSLSEKGRIYISAQAMRKLPKHMALYENGEICAFKADKIGFKVTIGVGTAGGAISSAALAEHLRNKFSCHGSMQFYTHTQGDVIFFAAMPFEKVQDFAEFRRCEINEKKDCYASIIKTGIYLSKQAAGDMSRRASFYRCGEVLALVADERGSVKIAVDNKIWAPGLPGYLCKNMGIQEAELYAYPANEAVYMAARPVDLANVKIEAFEKLDLKRINGADAI